LKTNNFIYEILTFTETKIHIFLLFLFKMTIDQFEIRLLVALLLGATIGLEREWQQKIAGIRTNALVALGAALFVLLSNKISGDSSSTARIVSQIVSGMGFLGAGAIMKEGLSVSGINTTATIWCSMALLQQKL
jgi:putative Mg2+ transporter-C (MgtC) family protein